jgi:predicted metal-dependent peptidase
MQDTEKRLQGAMMRIRCDHPFFGTLGLFAELVITEDIGTAATDGKRLLFNPGFVAQQDTPRLCGLLVHELLHTALLHVPRRGVRDPELWNIAADIVVNGVIRSDTVYDLPASGVEDSSLAHLSVEEIYEQLRAGKIPVPGITLLDLIGTEGQGIIDEDRAAELQRHWRSALQQAGAVARRMGKGFGNKGLDTLRDVTEATTPSLDWRALLWQFLVATPCDFSGFDRRFVWQNQYLEEVVGESVDVAIVIDTSASIGSEELGAFLGEIEGILNAYPQIRGQLFFADADLYGPYLFSRDAELPPPKGGGGTSFVPFFKWVEGQVDRGERPLCIYFTDGYGSFPANKPDAPVLWVVIPGGLEGGKFPFGDVARLGMVVT